MADDPRPAALAFLDVEASSLDDGFPVEVGWCSADLTRGASYLIRPEPSWLTRLRWSAEAEAVHGLDQARLTAEGLAAAEVADRLAADLAEAAVQSDAPEMDGRWLDLLFDGRPFPLDRCRPAGTAAVVSRAGLRPHRALDDAVGLAMGYISFATTEHRLAPEQAIDRGRALIRRVGRK